MTSRARPNFLLFITDQHQANHLGCYGHSLVKTPNIDSIAARGTRFDRFHVTNPFCMPSRASIVTGRMPSAHGARINGAPLPLSQLTFVERLRASGYRTALVGKAHLQNMTSRPRAYTPSSEANAYDDADCLVQSHTEILDGPEYQNENHDKWLNETAHTVRLPYYGFAHVDLCTMHGDQVGGHYYRWLNSRLPDPNLVRGPAQALEASMNPPQSWRTRLDEDLYPTAYIGQQTVDWIHAHAGRGDATPFFLQCSFPDPHHPFTPPGQYWDMYRPEDVELPPSFGKGDSPLLRHLRRSFVEGTADRKSTLPFVVTEQEAREITALSFGAISMIDDRIGRVLSALRTTGLADNTVVIFMADHGEYMGDYGIVLKGPIHCQSMIRIPFLWSDPSREASRLSRALCSTLDLAPTILERAGLKPHHGLQGRSLLSHLSGRVSEHRDAVIVEDDREVLYLGFEEPQRVRTMVTEEFRMTLFRPMGYSELFDLKNDPHEIVNVWSDPAYAEVKGRLGLQMSESMLDLQDWCPLPTGRA